MRTAGDLATTHGPRGYDAVHLAAAHLVRADVFSSTDDRLCEAASPAAFYVAIPKACAYRLEVPEEGFEPLLPCG